MKHFTELEQNIIKQIGKSTENTSLFFIFEDYLKANKSVRLDLLMGTLSYPKTTKYDINKIVRDITNIATLLKYLDYHKYIYPIDVIDDASIIHSIEPIIKIERECNLIDIRGDIVKIIYYSQHKFYISDDLQFLLQNNFKTYEDMQLEEAKSQTQKAKCTLSIAVCTLVATCIIPLILPFIPYPHLHQDELHKETISTIKTIDTTLQQNTKYIIYEYKAYQDSCSIIQTKK